MARKVFQDFANVMCQRFVEVPSNRDLVNLFILGDGAVALDLIAQKATWNRYPIEPLPYAADARAWLDSQMASRKIPTGELAGASFTIKYAVEVVRKAGWPIPEARFDFVCTALISSPDRTYTSVMEAQKIWGLSTV